MSMVTAMAPPAEVRSNDDPAQVASEVFARILVREVQRSLPTGSLMGGDFAPLEALVTDALVATLTDQDRLGMSTVFSTESSPTPTIAPTQPSGPLVDDARVSSHFGMRTHPVHGALQHHDGIDLAAPEGSTIRAARAGRVIEARHDATYGNLVVVDHGGGWTTRYAHCRELGVHPGQAVLAGEPIATVGKTGRATGPHLHFEVRSHGTAVDPTTWMRDHRSPLPDRPQGAPPVVDEHPEDPGNRGLP